MAEILLSSEAFVKSVTSASDNLSGKYILPALREAQEIGLRGILGDDLLAKLKDIVRTGSVEAAANEKYKALLGYCQYYLAYLTIVEVTTKASFKIGNFGVAKSNDENLHVASREEISNVQYYYQSKADAACLNMQNFLLNNRTSFPELSDCACHKIESNLYSAASCGIFLGGARGKNRRCKR